MDIKNMAIMNKGVIMVKHQCRYLSDCCEALPMSRLDCDSGIFGQCSDCRDETTFACDGHNPWHDDDPKWWL